MPLAIVVKPFKTPTLGQMGIDTVRLECLTELNRISREMKKDFEKVVKHFSEPKPVVKTKKHLTRRDATASVDLIVTDPKKKKLGIDRVALLDKGTRGHMVVARRARAMRWRGSFRMKTRPRWIGSKPGGQFGSKRFSKRHWVRGIVPRQYGETMVKRWQRPFAKRMEKAARRGAGKARRQ